MDSIAPPLRTSTKDIIMTPATSTDAATTPPASFSVSPTPSPPLCVLENGTNSPPSSPQKLRLRYNNNVQETCEKLLSKTEDAFDTKMKLVAIKTNFPKMKENFQRLISLGVSKNKDNDELKQRIAALSPTNPDHDRLLTRLEMERYELQQQLLQIYNEQQEIQASSRAIWINEHALKRKFSALDSELDAEASRLTSGHAVRQLTEIVCKKQRLLESTHAKEKETLLEPVSHFNCFLCASNLVTHTTTCCNHATCEQCVVRWANAHSNCPFCRMEKPVFNARSIVF